MSFTTVPDERFVHAREVIKIQGSDGNWNYDPYMHGMLNGMLLMMSIFEGKDPDYREAPAQWLKDRGSNSEPVAEPVAG
jgi:hypothetical protein